MANKKGAGRPPKATKDKSERVTYSLNRSTINAIAKLAEQSGKSKSQVLKDAVLFFLGR